MTLPLKSRPFHNTVKFKVFFQFQCGKKQIQIFQETMMQTLIGQAMDVAGIPAEYIGLQ